MKYKLIFSLSVLVALVVAILHLLALKYNLYWVIWWFDIPMHFLGGICVGLMALSIPFVLRFFGRCPSFQPNIRFVFFIVITVGIFWEIFEYSIGFDFNMVGSYYLDVFKDIVMDILGGLVVYKIYNFSVAPKLLVDKENYGGQV